MNNNGIILANSGLSNKIVKAINFIIKYHYVHSKKTEANFQLTQLRIQKLLFFAYILYFKNNNEFLFIENFTAWNYGPVIEQLFFVSKGKTEVIFEEETFIIPIKEQEFYDLRKKIGKYFSFYNNQSTFNLVKMSHDSLLWKNSFSSKKKSISKKNIKEIFLKLEKK